MKTIRIFLAAVVMILAAQAQCFSQTHNRTEATDGTPLRLAVAAAVAGVLIALRIRRARRPAGDLPPARKDPAKRTCAVCGAPLSGSRRVCPYCGTKIE